ncbi:MAG: DUF3021 domain-containing protein [Clostridium sp.]|nr:DUF3021 domain-containing protein [Clostridium sp.]
MKRRIKFLWEVFSMILACVVIVVGIFTTIVNPIERVESVIFCQMAVVSFVCALSCFIFPWDRVMKKKEIVIRIGIHYLLINLIVLGAGSLFDWYHVKYLKSLLAMIISIASIYAIVSGAAWRRTAQDTKRLNEKLEQYRGKKHEKLEP